MNVVLILVYIVEGSTFTVVSNCNPGSFTFLVELELVNIRFHHILAKKMKLKEILIVGNRILVFTHVHTIR